MASLIRLIRRSVRNTPTGGAETDSARQPASARRMKPNSTNGATRDPNGSITRRPRGVVTVRVMAP